MFLRHVHLNLVTYLCMFSYPYRFPYLYTSTFLVVCLYLYMFPDRDISGISVICLHLYMFHDGNICWHCGEFSPNISLQRNTYFSLMMIGDNVFLICHVRRDCAVFSVETLWQVLVLLMDVGISGSSSRRKLWHETMFLSRKNSHRSKIQRRTVIIVTMWANPSVP